MNDFIKVLSKIKHLIILDTYAAGEKKIRGATSRDLYKNLLRINKNVLHLKNIKSLNIILKEHTMKKNTIIFMGAGSITNIAKRFYNN